MKRFTLGTLVLIALPAVTGIGLVPATPFLPGPRSLAGAYELNVSTGSAAMVLLAGLYTTAARFVSLVRPEFDSHASGSFRCRYRMLVPMAAAARAIACSSRDEPPSWRETFGYSAQEVHQMETGEFGYPQIPVTIDDAEYMLPFDTGNMIGISPSSAHFSRSGLATADTYNRLNSAGRIVAALRVGQAREVSVLGRSLGPQRIYEFSHPTLPGLIGPDFVGIRP